MKKIVILGGTGFIGQYIVDELLESGYFVKMVKQFGEEFGKFVAAGAPIVTKAKYQERIGMCHDHLLCTEYFLHLQE